MGGKTHPSFLPVRKLARERQSMCRQVSYSMLLILKVSTQFSASLGPNSSLKGNARDRLDDYGTEGTQIYGCEPIPFRPVGLMDAER